MIGFIPTRFIKFYRINCLVLFRLKVFSVSLPNEKDFEGSSSGRASVLILKFISSIPSFSQDENFAILVIKCVPVSASRLE